MRAVPGREVRPRKEIIAAKVHRLAGCADNWNRRKRRQQSPFFRFLCALLFHFQRSLCIVYSLAVPYWRAPAGIRLGGLSAISVVVPSKFRTSRPTTLQKW